MSERNSAVTKKLAALDLSPHEAEVYVTVLELGEASAGQVLDRLNLHREQVYRALKRLTVDGLLSNYQKKKRNYYTTTDPQILVTKAEEKAATARSVLTMIEQVRQQKPQTIRVSEGQEGLKQYLEDLIKAGEYLIIGGTGSNFYEVTKEYVKPLHKRYLKAGVTGRSVIFKDRPYKPSHLPAIEEGVGAVTTIYGNNVSIQILDPQNIATITITNKRIADAYRHTFYTLWSIKDPDLLKEEYTGLYPKDRQPS